MPTSTDTAARHRERCAMATLGASEPTKEIQMPVILWLLGVPLVVIVLLMLFGVL